MEQQLIDDLLDARTSAEKGGLKSRERIATLCDANSFQEYGALTRSGDATAAGIVAGLGRINGHPAVVVANDGVAPTSIDQAQMDRMMTIAVEKAWPFVFFAGGGEGRADAAVQSRSLGMGGSRIGLFDGLCELSGLVPSIAIITGETLDQDAAIAMFSDFVVATNGSSIGMGEGEPRPVEEAEKQGDIDLVVAGEAAAIAAVRTYVSLLLADEPAGDASPEAARIADILPASRRRAYDMHKVITAIADVDSILELRPNWGTSLITSLVRIAGRTVGIFANQPMSRVAGAIDATAADKMCRFIELCDAYGIPLLSLIDSPGFHIGKEAERGGIARHHVRTLSAIEHRDVPLYCVQIRKAYGLGPLVMRGSWGHLPPELRLAWPTVETGGMSLEGAAYLTKRKEILAAKTPEEALAIRDEYANTLRARESGVRAGRNFSFDDIILPEETRDRVIAMLDLSPRIHRTRKKTYLDTV